MQYTLSQIDSIADTFVKEVLPHSQKVLLFQGAMGAGKTTFIKALCRSLGVGDRVSSPTFSLVNEYQAHEGKVFHFDLYRIEEEQEALDFGIEELVLCGMGGAYSLITSLTLYGGTTHSDR